MVGGGHSVIVFAAAARNERIRPAEFSGSTVPLVLSRHVSPPLLHKDRSRFLEKRPAGYSSIVAHGVLLRSDRICCDLNSVPLVRQCNASHGGGARRDFDRDARC